MSEPTPSTTTNPQRPETDPETKKPSLASRILKSKKTYITTGISTLYIPYIIHFPHLNPAWPLWLTILSYIPLYFLTGFLLAGLHFLHKHHQKKKQSRKQNPTPQNPNVEVAPQSEVGSASSSSIKSSKWIVPKIIRYSWLSSSSKETESSDTKVVWEARDFERAARFPITDNSEVVRRREMEGYEDVDLGEGGVGARNPFV